MIRTLDRTFYAPQTYNALIEKEGQGVVYLTTNSLGKPSATGFSGKKSKPTFNYYFNNEIDRVDYIEKFFNNLQESENRKEQRKLDKKLKREQAKTAWNIGDLLCSSWGYDQTNVDFYQVTGIKGSKVTFRKIGGKVVPGSEGRDCCKVVASKDSFVEDKEEFTKIATNTDFFKLTSYSNMSRTTETESHYNSWYY